MTQQSLITRLKAVEEALVNSLDCSIALRELERDLLVLGTIRRTIAATEAALSDLRELIKEAEGQQEVGLTGIVYAPTNKPLYTALGEKPAAAEQQLAKETKE